DAHLGFTSCPTRRSSELVDVDDLGVGCDGLGHLVGVLHRGQPGADVEELADPGLGRQEADGADQEVARLHRHVRDLRVHRSHRVADLPVGGVVVLAAQPVVPDARPVRDVGADLRQGLLGHGRDRSARTAVAITRSRPPHDLRGDRPRHPRAARLPPVSERRGGPQMTTAALATAAVQRYLAAWNATDPAERRAAVEAAFAPDARYVDPLADVTGTEALDALIAGVHQQFP